MRKSCTILALHSDRKYSLLGRALLYIYMKINRFVLPWCINTQAAQAIWVNQISWLDGWRDKITHSSMRLIQFNINVVIYLSRSCYNMFKPFLPPATQKSMHDYIDDIFMIMVFRESDWIGTLNENLSYYSVLNILTIINA